MAFFNRLFGKDTSGKTEAANAVGVEKAMPQSTNNPASAPPDAWLLLKAPAMAEVTQALQMCEQTPCTWEGARAAVAGPAPRLFVAEPIQGVFFVTGKALPDLAYRVKACTWLAQLSSQLPEVYSFAAQDKVQVYAFAQAKAGEIVRAYAVAQGTVRTNKGAPCAGETSLGFQLPQDDDQLFEPDGLTMPSTKVICALSAALGLDTGKITTATKGILGTVEKI